MFNLLGLLWLLGFIQVGSRSYSRHCVQVVIDNIVAKFVSAWQEEGGKEMSLVETATLLLSSGRKVFCLQTIAKAAFPCSPLPFFASSSEELTSPGQEDGEDPAYLSSGCWWTWWWWWPRTNQESSNSPSTEALDHNGKEIAETRKQVGRVVHLTVFTAETVSTLLASIISYVILAHTLGSPLAMELSHR